VRRRIEARQLDAVVLLTGQRRTFRVYRIALRRFLATYRIASGDEA
jgi:hypothetical protein